MAVGVAGTVAATRLLAEQVGDTAHLANVPEQPDIVLEQLNSRSVVYDKNGNELAVLRRAEDRELVPLSRIPKQLQDAVVGIEDRFYYQHNGVNIRGTMRALLANTESGDISQGGSTITQQLVKQSLLGTQQTVERKVKEAALAIRLEKQMSKDQILERYLNIVYLGNRAYGMQAASQTYFNKDVDQIQWPEIALLVSIIPNPSNYDPIDHPETSKERRALVAKRLRELDVITPDLETVINATPLPTQLTPVPVGVTENQTIGTNYFVEEVKRTLAENPQVGEDNLYKGGLKIYTTFDPKAQGDAEAAVQQQTPNTNGRFVSALAAVEPGSGRVKALVGGPPGGESEYNAATQGGRQPGSSFKPIVLATAFSQGRVPNDLISGQSPCSFNNPGGYPNPYNVTNYEGSAGSTTSLKEQTIQSNNCAYVRLGQTVGQDKVVELGEKLGIKGLQANISLPLGTEEVTPLDMAAAYAAFAADGQYNAPYLIERVENAQGQDILKHESTPSTAMTPEVARLVTEVLEQNVVRGTGTKARIWGQQVAGKTGTTQDYGDAWFVGYSPYMATAVWMGNPNTNGDKMRNVGGIRVTGGSYPAEIWQAFMSSVHAGQPALSFPPAPGTRFGGTIG
ncbi:MAG: PBP1A family penicillin-binding protein [Microthrixaceae bacterium]